MSTNRLRLMRLVSLDILAWDLIRQYIACKSAPSSVTQIEDLERCCMGVVYQIADLDSTAYTTVQILIWETVAMQGTPKNASKAKHDWMRSTAGD